MELRAQAIAEYAAALTSSGTTIFSPVTFSRALSDHDAVPPDGWYVLDLHFLDKANRLIIMPLPGWDHSQGVITELAYAKSAGSTSPDT